MLGQFIPPKDAAPDLFLVKLSKLNILNLEK